MSWYKWHENGTKMARKKMEDIIFGNLLKKEGEENEK